MMKKTTMRAKSTLLYEKRIRVVEVLPFTERPPENMIDRFGEKSDGICAVELFSLFTADIIKEEKLFTR